MKKLEKKPVHTYLFDGEPVELVLDMRAKNLITRYARDIKTTADDAIIMLVIMFVAMVNSAAMRTGNEDSLLDPEDVLESDFDLNELTSIVNDVRTEAYRMEYKTQDQQNDLYADEVADNESPREGVS